MKTVTRFICLLLALITVCGLLAPAASAATSPDVASQLNGYLPLVTYAMPLSGASRVYSYSDASLRTRTTGYYIDTFKDQIVVTKISSDGRAVYVTYPSRSSRTGVRSRWFSADDILGLSTVSIQKYTFPAKSTTYRMRSASGLTSYGSISKGDSCLMLGTRAIGANTYCVYTYPISRGTYNKISGVRYKLALCASAPAVSYAPSTSNVKSDMPSNGSFVRISHAGSSLYLDVPAENANKAGVQLQIWSSAPTNTNQYFQLLDTGSGWQIISLHSGKVVEVKAGSHRDYAQVVQAEKHNAARARWDIIYNNDGTVSFKNRESGLYLNVYGNGTANGTQLIQYHHDSSQAEKFYIHNVSTSGYLTQAEKISSNNIKVQKNISLTSWHPFHGLTTTMVQQDASEAYGTTPLWAEAGQFLASWVVNSKSVTRIHVTQGTNKQMTIQYGTPIEQNWSGKSVSLNTLIVNRYYNYSPTIIFTASAKADQCIRQWFNLTGSGKYAMQLTFGKIPYNEYGYYLLIENGTVYQKPIIHANSTYKVYRTLNGKTTYMFDAAQILRNAKLQLPNDAAAVVMRQLVKNGYIR